MMATPEGSHLLPTNASYATFALIVAPLLLYAMFGERTYAMQLRGASVLVTGAGSGLGRALAIEAARRGARCVHLCGRREAPLEETKKLLASVSASEVQVEVHADFDVSNGEATLARCEACIVKHGAPDLIRVAVIDSNGTVWFYCPIFH